jgi:hypothetical protein
LLAFGLQGCGKNVSRQDIAGSYLGDYGFAKEVLE